MYCFGIGKHVAKLLRKAMDQQTACCEYGQHSEGGQGMQQGQAEGFTLVVKF